jgi:molybdopterin synthase catalytic subunit/molybdopterin converting factor small subunit
MQVRVLLFGVLKDLTGRAADTVTLPAGATLADLLARYQSEFPRLVPYAPTLALSVNQQYAPAATPLHENDEVALLPPVSGGTSAGASAGTSAERTTNAAAHIAAVALVRSRIETETVVNVVRRDQDGAVVVFEGTARNNTRGRRTLYLDYEGYEPMAEAELRRLVSEARSRFPIRDAAIVHRLGRLEIGETSVLIVVASAHRAAAFDACRWLIDTLKQTVPIWKKEHFADGAVWADGEPFPPEVKDPASR